MTSDITHPPATASGARPPSRRTNVGARAPIALFAGWACVAAAGLVLAWSNRHLHYVGPDGKTYFSVEMWFVVVEAGMSFVYAAVGAVVVARTRHVIGWLLLAIAVSFPALGLTEQYALHGLVTAPGSLPGTTVVGLLTLVVAGVTTTSITLILLLFPTGTTRSPRWRWAMRGALFAAGLWAVSYALAPGPFNGPWNDYGVHVDNPMGIVPLGGALKTTFAIGVAGSLLFSIAGVVCLVFRFRTSHGAERQQVKFLAYVGLLVFVLFAVQFVLGPVLRVAEEISNVTFGIFFITLMLGIPLAVGAAILRYRLFDIDRIVSRTLAYAVVTAFLGGIFALVVLVPTALISGGDTPGWVVAVATLVVFGLFRPVLRRVRSVVDCRFNRARYDAVRTIEAFNARLREEIDLATLREELTGIVGQTMQPEHVSVWVRGTTR